MQYTLAGLPDPRNVGRSVAPCARSSALPAPPRGIEPLFFRDSAGERLLKSLARRRLKDAPQGAPWRVWVPQCGGGEDAYSVAIDLIEAFGNRWREIPLCVISTDSDPGALARARAGRYPSDAVRAVSPKTFEKFFTRESGHVRVRPFVRDACRFVRHEFACDLPFSRLDLIAGRGVLAAAPAPARPRILRSFHAVLTAGGVLVDPTGTAAAAPELFASVGRGKTYVALDSQENGAGAQGRLFAGAEGRRGESDGRFQALFAGAEDALLVRDAETGLILHANEAAARLLGRGPADLLGTRCEDLLAPPEAVRRPENERRGEARLRLPHYRRKDGTVFAADVSTSLLMMTGRPCNLIMLRDAAPLLRLLSSHRRAEKRESHVGDVVHELRSPLSIIRGFVETLRDGVEERHHDEYLSLIESYSGRMARLVDQLLDLNAADCGKRAAQPAAILLSKAVWEIAGAFTPVAKRRRISIMIDISADLAVLADPSDMPHVVGNLLDNAIKFSPQGGKIFVSGRAEAGEAMLSVHDTGKGIAPEDLTRVFERFFRGANGRRAKGTGLGLSIVREIVKANGGRVLAENGPTGGAIFHVVLPLAPERRS
ncbi:MAG: ATP-binding protein [Elusimicrobiota bacterium]